MGLSGEQVAGEVYGTAKEVGLKLLDNVIGKSRSRWDRYWNHLYGEASANAADLRTRALYNDFYSPEALLGQYETAGLSPSLMFGGTPGQGGMQGAMGSNAGIQTPVFGMSALEAAQVANMFANTEKTKAETKNIETDTARQEIQKSVESLKANQYKWQFTLMSATVKDKDTGQAMSIPEIAAASKTYDDFVKKLREIDWGGEQVHGNTEWIREMGDYFSTEFGQRDLRAIYTAQHQFSTNISILSSDKVAADFQRSITQVLANSEFAEKNKDAAIAYLNANIETANLTQEQKGAWNDLIKKIKEGAGETTANIVMILAMILNQGMSKWHMPTMNFGGQTYNKYVGE